MNIDSLLNIKPCIMDEITHEDIQRARRISRALQEFLKQGAASLRSTDVYEYLVRKGLIERDRHNGLFLRKFLEKLRNADLLKLIPQCTHKKSDAGTNEWYFNWVSDDKAELNDIKLTGRKADVIHAPQMTKGEIDRLIDDEKASVDNLRKRDSSQFTSQELEIRRSYPRAYEYWSEHEYEIMVRIYSATKNVEKVAELLQRQPHIVQEKLVERKLL